MAAYGSYRGNVQDQYGRPISGVTVTVYLTGTATPATLYSDRSLTALANPFTNEADGSWIWYADVGNRYDIVFSKTGVTFDNTDFADIVVDQSTGVAYLGDDNTFTGNQTFNGTTNFVGNIISTLNVVLGNKTVDTKNFDGTVTWNNGAVTFTAIRLNVTDTASNAASKLIDLQVSASSKFNVDKSGNVAIGGNISGAGIGGTPSNIGTANAAGSGPVIPFVDHVHNHPSGLGENLHHNKLHEVWQVDNHDNIFAGSFVTSVIADATETTLTITAHSAIGTDNCVFMLSAYNTSGTANAWGATLRGSNGEHTAFTGGSGGFATLPATPSSGEFNIRYLNNSGGNSSLTGYYTVITF